jgi:hypothetical protein
MSRHEPLVEFDSVLRDQAAEVATIFAAVVDQPLDSDQLVLANPANGPMRSRTPMPQVADLRVWLPK